MKQQFKIWLMLMCLGACCRAMGTPVVANAGYPELQFSVVSDYVVVAAGLQTGVKK